jgi:hypothetical protein
LKYFLAQKGRLRAWLVGLSFATVASIAMPMQAASAAPIEYQNRISGYFGDTSYGGKPIDGVTGSIYIRNNKLYTTGSTANVNLVETGTGYNSFIQAGVIQGDAKLIGPDGKDNNCGAGSGETEYVNAPTFFVGIWHEMQGGGDWCETLINLGTFGSTGNYRQVGIRHAGGTTWYVTLDGVEKWRGQFYIAPGKLRPHFSGETNDTCTTLYARAEATTVNKATLAFHTSGGPWTLWPSIGVARRLYHPTLYSISAPHANTPAAMWAWGPTSEPGYGC